MKQERHVLVVFPHPDDEAFGVSGTIAKHVHAGTPVTYICLTLGEMGRNLGNPPFATRESLPLIRKQELQRSAEALGINDLRMMGFRDKTIEFEDDETLTKLVEDAVNELSPSLVISFYPGYSVHPDHDATGRAVVRALKRLPTARRPKLHCIAFSNNHETKIGAADVIVDVSRFTEQKINSMRAHHSQTAWMLKDMEPKWAAGDKEALRWLQEERFWTYPFEG
ncbi:bacillithiol biosynthesis deacetylase BshB2 [Halalkalibacter urbisdiaboli]|uniref:bacillithiol biosynthesis deacetylase BshB2 n=1 Tax=Halalkalibacter urbisdiaboli TaxID=1960589 RepID=UPI000B43E70B|nr:bacillithiol biosynthesis deacetylase BshB2 [Halalkalibacter urbisdiaboli]